jgi:hypothetical protein
MDAVDYAHLYERARSAELQLDLCRAVLESVAQIPNGTGLTPEQVADLKAAAAAVCPEQSA